MCVSLGLRFFFFSSRRRHTRWLVVTGVQTVLFRSLLLVAGVVHRATSKEVTPLELEVMYAGLARSEERRVGKECYQPCRYRGSPAHSKKKDADDDTLEQVRLALDRDGEQVGA